MPRECLVDDVPGPEVSPARRLYWSVFTSSDLLCIFLDIEVCISSTGSRVINKTSTPWEFWWLTAFGSLWPYYKFSWLLI